MNLIKFDPFPVTDSFGTFIDDFFNRSISDFVGSDIVMSRPFVNVTDFEDHIEIDLAAPGLEKSDFKIEIDKDQLVISTESEERREEREGEYTRKEFNYNAFKRSFNLSDNLDRESIQAGYMNGILKISITKNVEKNEEDKSRVIEIQ